MKNIRFFVAILVCVMSQIVYGQDVIVYTIDGTENKISKVDSIAFSPKTTIFQKGGNKVSFDSREIDSVVYSRNCIQFKDSVVKSVLLAHGVGSNGEISYEEAAKVTSIEQWFRGNTEIKSFDEFQYFTSVVMNGTKEFYACTSLESIILPPSVDYLLNDAFCDAKKLNNVVITSKNFHTFGEGCLARTGLSGEFAMPQTLRTIGKSAFFEGTAISKFYIPKGVESIGFTSFAFIEKCTDIYMYAETPPTLEADNFVRFGPGFTIHVPMGSLAAYKEANRWRAFSSKMVEFDTTDINPWTKALPDNPDKIDDSKVTSKISANYRGGAVKIINGVIQSGSQLNFQFENNSTKSVVLNGLSLINGKTGVEGNFMSTNDVVIAAGTSSEYTITVGLSGITEPICRFTYTYNGKQYTIDAAYKSLNM